MLEISVTKLFGHFDYRFELTDTGITILTGPNGFGKSTILKSLYAVSDSDLRFFVELQFEQFEVYIKKTKDFLKITKIENGLIVNEKEVTDKEISSHIRGLSMAKRTLDQEDRADIPQQTYHSLLARMSVLLGKVQFIREQRLIDTNRKTVITSSGRRIHDRQIQEVADDIPVRLIEKIRQIDSVYSQVSNKLDSTYPKRLFQQEKGIAKEEFSEKLQLMKERVEKLNSVGVSNVQELEIDEFKPEDARALKVYFEDFEEKYQVYEALVERLQLFTEIVNKRFLFKKVRTSGGEGLWVTDSLSGNKIRLPYLSSGEKEILVLFYSLLFEIPDQSFLLIDEPEISLHIAWQRLFADDLKEITKLKKLNVLVATHSPQIINGNMDIQIDLGELYKNGLNKG